MPALAPVPEQAAQAGNDGLVIIEPNDYNVNPGDNFVLIPFITHSRNRSAGTTTLDQMRRLVAENQDLVVRLRREAQERERVSARLVDASRMSAVGELAAAVAHEVNNPLAIISGNAQLLAEVGRAEGLSEDLMGPILDIEAATAKRWLAR